MPLSVLIMDLKNWFRPLVLLFLAVAAIVIMAVLLIGQHVPTDDPEVHERTAGTVCTFPDLAGTNLLFDRVRIPGDLDAGPKLIVTAYDVKHRSAAYDWLAPLQQLNEEFPQLSGYFVPLLPKSASNSAAFVIGTMAIAIGDDWEHGRTIVVFTDVDKFNALVDVDTYKEIQLFLIDRDAHIVWRGSGGFDTATFADLRAAIELLVERDEHRRCKYPGTRASLPAVDKSQIHYFCPVIRFRQDTFPAQLIALSVSINGWQ